MTSIQKSTFTGREFGELRPGASVQKGDMQALMEAIAYAYESLTGAKVPNAATIAATPHIHDGTNGARIRTPLVQQPIWANLQARDSSWGASNTPAFKPFFYQPFFAPAGVTVVDVLSAIQGPGAPSIHCNVYDATAIGTVSVGGEPSLVGLRAFEDSNITGYTQMRWRLAVNPGEVNNVACFAWDGYSYLGTDAEDGTPLPRDRLVQGVQVLPIDGPPFGEPLEAAIVGATSSDYDVPATLFDVDQNFIDDDRAVGSHLLTWASKNISLLREVLSGRPAGLQALAALTHQGHQHGGTGATDLDRAGAEIDACLGSWHYGTVRETTAGGGDYISDVHQVGTSNVWEGRVIAPTLTRGSNSAQTVARHFVRIPAASDVSLGVTAGTSKIKMAVLLYKKDTSTTTVHAQLFNSAGANGGGSSSGTSNTFGLSIATATDISVSTDLTGAGGLQRLEVDIQPGTNKKKNVAILGSCLYFEA